MEQITVLTATLYTRYKNFNEIIFKINKKTDEVTYIGLNRGVDIDKTQYTLNMTMGKYVPVMCDLIREQDSTLEDEDVFNRSFDYLRRLQDEYFIDENGRFLFYSPHKEFDKNESFVNGGEQGVLITTPIDVEFNPDEEDLYSAFVIVKGTKGTDIHKDETFDTYYGQDGSDTRYLSIMKINPFFENDGDYVVNYQEDKAKEWTRDIISELTQGKNILIVEDLYLQYKYTNSIIDLRVRNKGN